MFPSHLAGIAAADTPASERSTPPKEKSAWPDLAKTASAALAVVESQLTIYYLKFMTWALGFLLLIPVALFLAVIGIYGLILLDHAANIALSAPGNPAWLSPLVRGGVYSLALIVALVSATLSIARLSAPKKNKRRASMFNFSKRIAAEQKKRDAALEQISHGLQAASDGAASPFNTVKDAVQSNPWKACALSLGAGLAVSSLVSSRSVAAPAEPQRVIIDLRTGNATTEPPPHQPSHSIMDIVTQALAIFGALRRPSAPASVDGTAPSNDGAVL